MSTTTTNSTLLNVNVIAAFGAAAANTSAAAATTKAVQLPPPDLVAPGAGERIAMILPGIQGFNDQRFAADAEMYLAAARRGGRSAPAGPGSGSDAAGSAGDGDGNGKTRRLPSWLQPEEIPAQIKRYNRQRDPEEFEVLYEIARRNVLSAPQAKLLEQVFLKALEGKGRKLFDASIGASGLGYVGAPETAERLRNLASAEENVILQVLLEDAADRISHRHGIGGLPKAFDFDAFVERFYGNAAAFRDNPPTGLADEMRTLCNALRAGWYPENGLLVDEIIEELIMTIPVSKASYWAYLALGEVAHKTLMTQSGGASRKRLSLEEQATPFIILDGDVEFQWKQRLEQIEASPDTASFPGDLKYPSDHTATQLIGQLERRAFAAWRSRVAAARALTKLFTAVEDEAPLLRALLNLAQHDHVAAVRSAAWEALTKIREIRGTVVEQEANGDELFNHLMTSIEEQEPRKPN